MAVKVSSFHTVEVIVEHGGKSHRVLFRYDPYGDKNGKNAALSTDGGEHWKEAAIFHQAIRAFAERCPFAFEEDGASGTAPAPAPSQQPDDFKF